jgi:hypothetical protein
MFNASEKMAVFWVVTVSTYKYNIIRCTRVLGCAGGMWLLDGLLHESDFGV